MLLVWFSMEDRLAISIADVTLSEQLLDQTKTRVQLF